MMIKRFYYKIKHNIKYFLLRFFEIKEVYQLNKKKFIYTSPILNKIKIYKAYIDYQLRPFESDIDFHKKLCEEYNLLKNEFYLWEKQLKLSLSTQWNDFVKYMEKFIYDEEKMFNFRSNQLAVGGYVVGAILNIEKEECNYNFTDDYQIAEKSIYRSEWGSNKAKIWVRRIIKLYSRLQRIIEPQFLYSIECDKIGNLIPLVFNGQKITHLFLEHVYFLHRIKSVTSYTYKDNLFVLELGGGYGGLAKLFKSFYRNVTYIMVDIPLSLHIAKYYIKKNFPYAKIPDIRDIMNVQELTPDFLSKYDFLFLTPNYFEKFKGSPFLDLVINTRSMQEMAKPYIDYYIRLIQKFTKGYFYWVNREVAPLRYGGMSFKDYPFDDKWYTVAFNRAGQARDIITHTEWIGYRKQI